jgi:hypothetical protein
MMYRLLAIMSLCSAAAQAGTDQVMAVTRNNATNFKDRALAYCVAQAYKDSPAGQDATKTGAVFLDFTYYSLDANPEIDALIGKYLRRDYSTPFEGYADAKFALLKCIDMYHGPELNQLVRKYVPHPDWIGDKPARKVQR